MAKAKKQEKVTVMLDEDVAQMLRADAERIERAHGVRVSMANVATAAIKRGVFNGSQAVQAVQA